MRLRTPLLALFLIAGLLSPAVAAERAPLIVGWIDIPPLFHRGPDGEPDGFSRELIGRLGEIAGFEVLYKRFLSLQATLEAQRSGSSEALPGVVGLPDLEATNLFSVPVGRTRVRLFVRVEDTQDASMTAPEGRRIGIVPPVSGSGPSPLLERNIALPQPSTGTALLKLLSGDLDGVLLPEEMIWGEAHTAGLDHRVAAAGAPISELDRVVALHRDRAELLEPLNAAIAELEASGELADMRRRWFLDPPPPAPDILTVGVLPMPPHTIVRQDGGFTGYSVETLRDLAGLTGLKLDFRTITAEEFGAGPTPGGFDMMTPAAISDDRRRTMDFTLPIQRAPFSIFVRSDEAARIADLNDLVGRPVGVDRVDLARYLAEEHGRLDLTILDGPDALVQALLERRVDAILYPTRTIREIIARGDLDARIDEVRPPFFVSERAPALRFGLGNVRERLNAVIPGYLVSERHEALAAEWLDAGRNLFWTEARVRTLILICAGVVLLLAGLLVFSLLHRRHHVARERQRFAAEIVSHLPVGVLLISPEGTIDFMNLASDGQTPRQHPLFRTGQDFRSTVRQMIDEGWVDTEGRSEAAMIEIMTEEAFQDGKVREIRFTDGKIFRRTSKLLESGSTLIVREDVTDYRNQLLQIERLNADLEQQIRRTEIANDELRAFAYATSHDLKAPSNTLVMAVEALAEIPAIMQASESADLIGVLRRTTNGMRALIDDILTYTNAIGSDPVHEPVDLNAVAADVLEALGADIAASAAEIRLGPLPTVDANPTQMHQLLQNLIGNAVKFRAEGRAPVIDIAPAGAPPGCVGFKVRDNGIGIAREHREKVFQLFSRLNRKSLYQGVGLGLAICQRIALNHQGRIELASEPGQGACFTVILKERADDSPSHAD
ncbi:MAG: transporter substrate-binding domain-containing protein [Alphaproteobacteria bacterium]